MKLTVVLFALLALAGVPVSSQALTYLPLPVSNADGLAFSRGDSTLLGVLVGFELPATGPLYAIAELTATLAGEGNLALAVVGTWKGTKPAQTVRVEKTGSAVAGLRLLCTVAGRTVRLRQLQVLFKPWTDGALGTTGTWSRVYGELAGANEVTKIVEVQIQPGAYATSVHGTLDGGKVAQLSLVQRQVAKAVSATTTPNLVSVGVAPLAPVAPAAPEAPTVELKR